MNRWNLLWTLIAVLILGNIFFIWRTFTLQNELTVKNATLETRVLDDKVLSFTNLFVTKVLEAQGPVSLDDRLNLENSVRALNDPDIFQTWTNFVNSKTPEDAQVQVKNLLARLVQKIKIQ